MDAETGVAEMNKPKNRKKPGPAGMDPRLARWLEWGEACTIQRCGPETVEYLSSFARVRARKVFRVYNASKLFLEYEQGVGGDNARDEEEESADGISGDEAPGADGPGDEKETLEDGGDCEEEESQGPESVSTGRLSPLYWWWDLECYLLDSGHYEGRGYKAWLFNEDKAPNTPAKLEGYATLAMRTSLREMIIQFSPDARDDKGHFTNNVPLDAPLKEDGPALADLLPGEFSGSVEELMDQEEVQVLQDEVSLYLQGLSGPLRMAIALGTLGISLDAPRVPELLGRKKSSLYEWCAAWRIPLRQWLRKRHPFMPPESLDSAPRILEFFCEKWSRSPENPRAALFVSIAQGPKSGAVSSDAKGQQKRPRNR